MPYQKFRRIQISLSVLVLLLPAQVEKTKPLEPETFLTFDYEMNEHEPRSQEKNENFRLCLFFAKSSPRSSHRKKNSSCNSLGCFSRVCTVVSVDILLLKFVQLPLSVKIGSINCVCNAQLHIEIASISSVYF